jgi:hypothetical protein
MLKIGNRKEVINGIAKKTSGGLTKRQLKYNKQGKIVSRKVSNIATQRMTGGFFSYKLDYDTDPSNLTDRLLHISMTYKHCSICKFTSLLKIPECNVEGSTYTFNMNNYTLENNGNSFKFNRMNDMNNTYNLHKYKNKEYFNKFNKYTKLLIYKLDTEKKKQFCNIILQISSTEYYKLKFTDNITACNKYSNNSRNNCYFINKNSALVYKNYTDFIRDKKTKEIDVRSIDTPSRLGAGAFGTVLQVRLNGKINAIKLVMNEPESINEFRILNLKNDYIVQTIGYIKYSESVSKIIGDNLVEYRGPSPKKIYRDDILVMEVGNPIIDDEVLCSNIYDASIYTRLQYMINIAKAVKYLHTLKLAHLDIKPENIIICGDVAKLADFGTSRFWKEKVDNSVGTPAYMANELTTITTPEVIKNIFACDIWSLGVTLYDIMFLTRVSNGLNRGLSMFDTLFKNKLLNIWRKCLSKNPVDRYSANNLVTTLIELSLPISHNK